MSIEPGPCLCLSAEPGYPPDTCTCGPAAPGPPAADALRARAPAQYSRRRACGAPDLWSPLRLLCALWLVCQVAMAPDISPLDRDFLNYLGGALGLGMPAPSSFPTPPRLPPRQAPAVAGNDHVLRARRASPSLDPSPMPHTSRSRRSRLPLGCQVRSPRQPCAPWGRLRPYAQGTAICLAGRPHSRPATAGAQPSALLFFVLCGGVPSLFTSPCVCTQGESYQGPGRAGAPAAPSPDRAGSTAPSSATAASGSAPGPGLAVTGGIDEPERQKMLEILQVCNYLALHALELKATELCQSVLTLGPLYQMPILLVPVIWSTSLIAVSYVHTRCCRPNWLTCLSRRSV